MRKIVSVGGMRGFCLSGMNQHGKGKCVRESVNWTDFKADGVEGCSWGCGMAGWTAWKVLGVKLNIEVCYNLLRRSPLPVISAPKWIIEYVLRCRKRHKTVKLCLDPPPTLSLSLSFGLMSVAWLLPYTYILYFSVSISIVLYPAFYLSMPIHPWWKRHRSLVKGALFYN